MGEVTAGAVVEALESLGFNAEIVQTGGGTLGVYVWREGGPEYLMGPGSYDWADPSESVFWTGDLYFGLDSWDKETDELRVPEPPFYSVPDGATVEQIATMVAEQYAREV